MRRGILILIIIAFIWVAIHSTCEALTKSTPSITDTDSTSNNIRKGMEDTTAAKQAAAKQAADMQAAAEQAAAEQAADMQAADMQAADMQVAAEQAADMQAAAELSDKSNLILYDNLKRTSPESITNIDGTSNRIPISNMQTATKQNAEFSDKSNLILYDNLKRTSPESITNIDGTSNRIPISDKNTSTSINWQNFICLGGVILGIPTRKRKRTDTNDRDQMDDNYQQEEACLILGEIAKFILEKPDRTRILHALSHEPKTFIDLQAETKMTEKTLYKYLKQLQRAGFVDRTTDKPPLLFTWSKALKEYYSLAKQHSNTKNN